MTEQGTLRVRVTPRGPRAFTIDWVRELHDRLEVVMSENIRLPEGMQSCTTQIRATGEFQSTDGVIWQDATGARHFVQNMPHGLFGVQGQEVASAKG